MGDSAAPRRRGAGDGPVRGRAVWTRVDGIGGRALDLLHARIPRRHYAPHAHEEFAIGVCTDGVEVIRCHRELHYVRPGDVVIIEPGEPHTGGPAVATGFAYRALYPGVALLADGSVGRPDFATPVVEDPWLADALRGLHTTLEEGTEPLDGECRLAWLLATLVRRHASTRRPLDADRAVGPVARGVVTRLADEMTSPPTLTEIATDLGLSRYQVLRAFRNEMGMPPYAWLAQHRVARARLLIEAGHRPAAAAAMVGFADQAHLTRWFQRVLGVTPGVYRNSVQDSVPRHL
ncbi:MAG: AraC family transcriptional regulator [Kutzneria sp.]|nr:AraC family transcriptional regulator [Kutzneria sp.]